MAAINYLVFCCLVKYRNITLYKVKNIKISTLKINSEVL